MRRIVPPFNKTFGGQDIAPAATPKEQPNIGLALRRAEVNFAERMGNAAIGAT